MPCYTAFDFRRITSRAFVQLFANWPDLEKKDQTMIFAQPFFYYWLFSSILLAFIGARQLWKPLHMSASSLDRQMRLASGELSREVRKRSKPPKVTFRIATFLLRSAPMIARLYWTQLRPHHERQQQHSVAAHGKKIESI